MLQFSECHLNAPSPAPPAVGTLTGGVVASTALAIVQHQSSFVLARLSQSCAAGLFPQQRHISTATVNSGQSYCYVISKS